MNKKMEIKYPGSEKLYMNGQLFPEIKVGMRRIHQNPTVKIVDGEKQFHENAPVVVYDTSGPYSDPNIEVDLEKGLPRLRESWISERGGVEQLAGFSSEYCRERMADTSLNALRFAHIRLPLRAKKGAAITQMAYARQGIITTEMEYVAIRENMNCAELGIETYITPDFVRQEVAAAPSFLPTSTTPKRNP